MSFNNTQKHIILETIGDSIGQIIQASRNSKEDIKKALKYTYNRILYVYETEFEQANETIIQLENDLINAHAKLRSKYQYVIIEEVY